MRRNCNVTFERKFKHHFRFQNLESNRGQMYTCILRTPKSTSLLQNTRIELFRVRLTYKDDHKNHKIIV